MEIETSHTTKFKFALGKLFWIFISKKCFWLNPWTLEKPHGYGGAECISFGQQTTTAPWTTGLLLKHMVKTLSNTEERQMVNWFLYILGGIRLIWLLKIYASSHGAYFSVAAKLEVDISLSKLPPKPAPKGAHPTSFLFHRDLHRSTSYYTSFWTFCLLRSYYLVISLSIPLRGKTVQ